MRRVPFEGYFRGRVLCELDVLHCTVRVRLIKGLVKQGVVLMV